MTTRTDVPHARRFRPLLLMVAGLLVMLAVGSGILAGATDPPCKDTVHAAQVEARAQARTTLTAVQPTGVDLQVRIWKLRIEFPWLKALPVRPAQHIVVSIFEVTRS
jgi:hypothetical protein